jgi:hypothetical protein
MSTLNHKIILYDDVCPLCKAYTGGFVSLGWLMPDHRVPFSQAPADIISRIDLNRARHEIPLYDTSTGETIYGQDALFYIIGEQVSILKPLFRFRMFRIIIFYLYQMITYNRRVIAGSRPPEQGFDCAPDFDTFYRWLYIGLMTAVCAIIWYMAAIPFDMAMIPLGSLTVLATFTGGLLPDAEEQATWFGHLTTVIFILLLMIVVLGWSPLTALITPAIGCYWFVLRIS